MYIVVILEYGPVHDDGTLYTKHRIREGCYIQFISNVIFILTNFLFKLVIECIFMLNGFRDGGSIHIRVTYLPGVCMYVDILKHPCISLALQRISKSLNFL